MGEFSMEVDPFTFLENLPVDRPCTSLPHHLTKNIFSSLRFHPVRKATVRVLIRLHLDLHWVGFFGDLLDRHYIARVNTIHVEVTSIESLSIRLYETEFRDTEEALGVANKSVRLVNSHYEKGNEKGLPDKWTVVNVRIDHLKRKLKRDDALRIGYLNAVQGIKALTYIFEVCRRYVAHGIQSSNCNDSDLERCVEAIVTDSTHSTWLLDLAARSRRWMRLFRNVAWLTHFKWYQVLCSKIMEKNSRLDEIQLLFSMYLLGIELFMEDMHPRQLENSAEILLKSANEDIAFTLKIKDRLEVIVRLPVGYFSNISTQADKPVQPIMHFRLSPVLNVTSQDGRELETRFFEWLEETVSNSSDKSEPVICAAIQWLQLEVDKCIDALSRRTMETDDLPPRIDTAMQPTITCFWIVSHHIRSPLKRRLITQWAAELHLSGCSMPGKPGIVVAEGASDDAEEFWRRLRGLQWKHIQLRDREILGVGKYTNLRFPDGFQELFLTHQSRFAWLHERNVSSDQFKLVFGIPGRISEEHQ